MHNTYIDTSKVQIQLAEAEVKKVNSKDEEWETAKVEQKPEMNEEKMKKF
mgnify:CR=1 FL=1